MEKLDYDELKQLLLNGDISIQDPIMVYDASGETSKNAHLNVIFKNMKNLMKKIH